MSAALVNYEVSRKDKQSSSKNITAEAMTVRGMGPNYRKGKEEFGKSKIDGREELKKNQCTFCREKRYWTIDCPKIKLKKKKFKSEANIIQAHGNDSNSSGYHFLSPLSVAIQRNLKEFWISMLPITFVSNENGLLVLKN